MTHYRLATLAETPTLAEMRCDFRLEESAGQANSEKSEFLQACATFMSDGIRRGDWWFWVAEEDEQLIACICISIVRKIPKPNKFVDGFGYVTNVYTRPAYRNKGIGSRLMNHVIEWGKEMDLENLIVWPSEESVAFYERAGYVPDPELRQIGLRPYVL